MKWLCMAALLSAAGLRAADENRPTGLMCELMAFPGRSAITDPKPDFGWIVNSPAPNDRQAAYRILVASRPELLDADRGDLWDSSRVESAQSVSVEYAGKPLEPGKSYWWKVRTDLESRTPAAWSEPQRFNMVPSRGAEPAASPPLDGSHWIWFPEPPGAGTRYFRRILSLPAGRALAGAAFLITVDDAFTLRVNGKEMASTSEHNAWKTFRRVDLREVLKPGENLVLVEAVNRGDAAGFTGRITVSYGSGGETIVPVDAAWEAGRTADGPWQKAKSLGPYGVAPWGTTASLPKPDDGGDKASEVLPDRYLPVREERRPVKVLKVADGHWYFDFGRAAFGTVRLVLDSPVAAEVEVHLGEEREGDAERVNRKPGGTRRYRMMKVPVAPGAGTYTVAIPPDRRNTGGAAIRMPPSIGEVMPFRYGEISGCPVPLKADSIVQVAVNYPFDDEAAEFRCSDETLNAVWEFCKYSIKATSFCGVYVDGDRERIPYEADAYINQLCHYGTDREYTLARHSHEYLIRHPTWPTEWALHSVLMAWADYEYTGDRESMARFYEDLRAKTLHELAREDGLISTKDIPKDVFQKIHIGRLKDIVDWPAGERDGYEFREVNTVVNAFHYQALVLFSRIAGALGRDAEAGEFARKARRAEEAINGKLFDAKRGVYLDGEGSAHASLHANMWPLAFGLVPAGRVPGVVRFVKSRGMACSVYGAQYLMEALYEAGEDDAALSLLTSKEERSWWNMMREGSTIAMEAWGNRFKANQDWNHAWGAVPANIIPRRLMGVTPLEPGFGRIRIRPQVGSLRSGSLKTPTIRGPVHVSFEQAPGRSFSLSVLLPANVTAEVHVPASGKGQVEVDGKAGTYPVEGRHAVVAGVGGGRHTFRSR